MTIICNNSNLKIIINFRKNYNNIFKLFTYFLLPPVKVSFYIDSFIVFNIISNAPDSIAGADTSIRKKYVGGIGGLAQ